MSYQRGGVKFITAVAVGSAACAGLAQADSVASSFNGGLLLSSGVVYNGSGSLDLGANSLVIRAEASNRLAVYDWVAALVKQGANRGQWNGLQGITSSAAAQERLTGLAAMLNDRGNGSPIITSLGQINLGVNDIVLKYTWDGDADANRRVNADDYFVIDSGFLSRRSGYRGGDFNYDGKVNADDYYLIDAAFLGQGPPGGEQTVVTAQAIVAVPLPPAITGLGLLAGWALTTRRRTQ